MREEIKSLFLSLFMFAAHKNDQMSRSVFESSSNYKAGVSIPPQINVSTERRVR